LALVAASFCIRTQEKHVTGLQRPINYLRGHGLVQVVERFKGKPTFAHLTIKDVVRSRVAELAATLL